jgi:lipoyl(octanoyl) transferase
MDLGVRAYEEVWALQKEMVAARQREEVPDTLLLVEHPHVITLGRGSHKENLVAVGDVPMFEIERGGDVTYHGPGQLVGYPIVRLGAPLDVVAYVRRVEQVLIDTCADLGLSTVRIPGRSGVWVTADERGPDRKVAAIGIRVARGVTLHGFALNCDCDLAAFDRIVPCGIRDAGVTSLSRELGRDVTVAEVLPLVEQHLPTVTAATG